MSVAVLENMPPTLATASPITTASVELVIIALRKTLAEISSFMCAYLLLCHQLLNHGPEVQQP
jgi:hypothetical protein